MPSDATYSGSLIPGTTGWTARHLDDPAIEAQWIEGRYEIISGVLATLPPNYFPSAQVLSELVFLLKTNLKGSGISDNFGGAVDIIIAVDRLLKVNAVWMPCG
jgi:hypothetical protein